MFCYIEIVAFDGDKVIRRVDVTYESERNRAKIDSGININLNHNQYYTRDKQSDIKLPIGEIKIFQ